jgi:MurNAc alpha-1-phosphate uridylyltransferase
MHAVILAAGRGERLRPLTDHKPKALLAVAGVPLVEHVLRRLARAGVTRAVVNLCWLGDQIRAFLGDGQAYGLEVVYSPETVALETAGGVRLALKRGLVESDPFLLHNADVLSDIKIEELSLSPNDEGLLVLAPNPPEHPQGDFACVKGRVRIDGADPKTYSGVGLYRKSLFEPLTDARAALRPLLESAARQDRLAATVHTGRWWDVGTPVVLDRLEALSQNGFLDGL